MSGNRTTATRPEGTLVRQIAVLAAAVAVAVVWFVLSLSTGLIFHFMPAAPILAVAWARRALGPDAPVPWPTLRIDLASGVLVAVVGAVAVAAGGGSLDAVWLVGAVIVVGLLGAIWFGRRSA